MSIAPTVLWAQRADSVFITVDVAAAEDVKYEVGEQTLSVSCKNPEGKQYACEIKFFKELDKEGCKFAQTRLITFFLKKKEEGWWDKLQDGSKLNFVKCDWNKWKDEDDDDAGEGFDMDGLGDG